MAAVAFTSVGPQRYGNATKIFGIFSSHLSLTHVSVANLVAILWASSHSAMVP